MNLKINEILAIAVVAHELRQAKPPDVKLRYRLARNLRLIEQELRHYEDMRQELLQEHGAMLDEGKGEYTLPDKRSFEKAHRELLDTDVDVELHPLTLEQVEMLDLSVGAIAALGELISEE